jgi:hypothetical protein
VIFEQRMQPRENADGVIRAPQIHERAEGARQERGIPRVSGRQRTGVAVDGRDVAQRAALKAWDGAQEIRPQQTPRALLVHGQEGFAIATLFAEAVIASAVIEIVGNPFEAFPPAAGLSGGDPADPS